MLWRDTICLLGIPVDRVTAGEALGRIQDMFQGYAQDKRPRLVSTLNADFMANALSGWSLIPRNAELLQVLREADLVLAEGRPLRWLCKHLGTPLPGGISSQGFLFSLAREATRRGKSVYLLGASPETVARSQQEILRSFPALRIAGTDACAICADDEADLETAIDNPEMLERINASGADILLLGFGNPAQELWFHRNRARLTVPVTVGVGYAFSMVGGQNRPAPRWLQHWHLEWVWRLVRKPGWLWRRHVRDVSDFAMLAIPVILASGRMRKTFFPKHVKEFPCLTDFLHRLSDGTTTSAILELPACITDEQVKKSDTHIVERAFGGDGLVVDAAALKFVDAAGIGFLFSLMRESEARGQYFHIIAPAAVRRLFTMSRAWDIFEPYFCASYEEMILRVEGRLGREFCYCGTKNEGDVRRMWIFGRLDASTVLRLEWMVDKSTRIPGDTILDMGSCVFVDEAGGMFLNRVSNALRASGKRLIIIRMQPPAVRFLKTVKLDAPLELHPDFPAALATLGRTVKPVAESGMETELSMKSAAPKKKAE